MFSSRLSQSQQSALYQQYEVQDDTVRDYVPVIEEEEDEDDDDADAKKNKQKIAERETKLKRKAKQQAESTKEQEKKKQRQNKDGWLSGLFGKNDGKENQQGHIWEIKTRFIMMRSTKGGWINQDQLKSN